ncbi:MAG: DNA gyrase subunit A, partial [Deltaproteobacteria bacterium]|nr:DNA gyrase subunit A [Deltaproteobacteria bacterium]
MPEEGPYSRGRAIVNLLKLDEGETIKKVLSIPELSQEGFVTMVSAQGKIKKTSISEFSRPRSTGVIALTIDQDDQLVDVNLTSGENHILMATRKGKAIRFHESQIRPMGRQARGVTGIRMRPDDAVIAMEVVSDDSGTLLTITQNGLGKRTSLKEYPPINRGGQGVITIRTTEKSGDVVTMRVVEDQDHILILTSGAKIIRLRMEEISVLKIQ